MNRPENKPIEGAHDLTVFRRAKRRQGERCLAEGWLAYEENEDEAYQLRYDRSRKRRSKPEPGYHRMVSEADRFSYAAKLAFDFLKMRHRPFEVLKAEARLAGWDEPARRILTTGDVVPLEVRLFHHVESSLQRPPITISWLGLAPLLGAPRRSTF